MTRTRTLTALFSIARLAFGAGLAASPEIAIRALATRDAAIAAGTLATLRDPRAQRLWIAAAMLSDLGDVAATLAAPPRALPRNARQGTVALGGASALAGAGLLAAKRR